MKLNACPKCQQGDVFQKRSFFAVPKMNTRCSSCDYAFEREPGYFLGAMYVSYGLTVFELIVVYLLLFQWLELGYLLITMLVVLLIMMFWNFKLSRQIWIQLFNK